MASFRSQTFLDPASAGDSVSKQKKETTRIAKEQEKAIHEKLSRNNHPIPKYEFLELIGKGAYGRVFKANDLVNNRVVALKVIDVDSHDYKVNALEKDDSIEVTMHEIKVLKQLKDSNTRNVNIIFDAFQIHSQLWIVNEYCPGGSVRTLMRGTGDKLEDKYIVPIARELAIALKAIHDGGIIHRDIKAANVMIHEKGRLQVIDFGVAGVLQTNVDKRSTVIGTPHWMAPELHKLAPPEGLNYGTEVDVWAFGCTLYEIATGMPPYPKTQPGRVLGITLGRTPPRLDKSLHSTGLVDLVAFVLEAKPADRPSMQEVLRHPYILNSDETHPTRSLAELVKVYYRWEHSGGQRQSLFINAGAAAAEFPSAPNEEDDWNFSTTSNFEKELDEFSFDPDTTPNTTSYNLDSAIGSSINMPGSLNQKTVPSIIIPGSSPLYPAETHGAELQTPTHDISPENANTEERVKRGEKALKGLFNESQDPYEYKVKADFVEQKPVRNVGALGKPIPRTRSDLPLRDESVQSSVYRKELDADQLRSISYNSTPNIDLANVGTIKANRMNRFIDNMGQDDKGDGSSYYAENKDEDKRATKEWTFPQAMYNDAKGKDIEASTVAYEHKRATIEWGFPPEMNARRKDALPVPERPALKHTVTAPVGDIGHSMGGMIDLDALYDSELYDSDILRTAPVSDDEGFSGLASEDEAIPPAVPIAIANEAANGQMTSDDDKTILPPSSVSGDELMDHEHNLSKVPSKASLAISGEYDPFIYDDSSDDELKAEANPFLDSSGVMNQLDRATLRRDYLKARTTAPGSLRDDIDSSSYGRFKKRRFATAVLDRSERTRGTYLEEKYHPDNNPAPETMPHAKGSPTRLGDADFPLSNGLQTQFGPTGGSNRKGDILPASATVAPITFPDLVPPSAESLLADAPAAVVETELRRLMGDWMTGLDILARIFDSSVASGHGAHATATAAGGGKRGSGGWGLGNGVGSENGTGATAVAAAAAAAAAAGGEGLLAGGLGP